MTAFLSGTPVSKKEQENNDRHRPVLVLAVFAFLILFIYLFTYASRTLDLPMPQDLAESLGLAKSYSFDADRNIDSFLYIPMTFKYGNDDERLIFFLGVGIAFLLVYFLPLKHKQTSLVFSSLAIIGILYGIEGAAGLLCAHILVYIILHPLPNHRLWVAVLPGYLGIWAFHPYESIDTGLFFLSSLSGCLSYAFYKFLLRGLLSRPEVARLCGTLVVQSALITTLVGAVLEGLGTETWKLALGILLFFWHWERLFMYHIDYKDGQIPQDISLITYLSVFFTPGQIANWNWGVTIGQGYTYTVNNFLCEDKNKLVLSGLKLWVISLTYLLFGSWAHEHIFDFLNTYVPVYWKIQNMNCAFLKGNEIETLTVLLTSLLHLIKWTFAWSGVMHFKVGLWRICGYKIDPYFNYPWLSTNLVTLWSRFTFHYREFLVRAFYYPVFFKFFKKQKHLRIFAATLAAAGFGNLIWGHIPEAVFYYGMKWGSLTHVIEQWPYFVLLGIGITVSEFWLLHKKKTHRRKPWALDKHIGWDFLAAYVTLQYYSLIHIFYYLCENSTLSDRLRLFLIGLGIHI